MDGFANGCRFRPTLCGRFEIVEEAVLRLRLGMNSGAEAVIVLVGAEIVVAVVLIASSSIS
jgi:hypothetical protein